MTSGAPSAGADLLGVAAALQDSLAGADAGTATAVLRHLLQAREYDYALELVDVWWDRHREVADFVRVVRLIQGKTGRLTDALRSSQQLVRLRAMPYDGPQMLEARIRELSGTVPTAQGPSDAVVPSSPHRVVHLVKESRPYLSNGFTSRSHYNFLAEKEAGLDPVVLTEPGFPRNIVGEQARREMRLDGIGHYHLDIGPADAKAMVPDRYLELFADLALERVRAIRPAVIHASSGRRGYETALVALAVRERTGIPVVYEVRSFFESNWTDEVRYEDRGELYESRMRLEEKCMREADLVLTISESMRREIIERGIPADKVGIIPNGVDSTRFAPRERHQELADSLGIGNAPTFGYVSNMDHYRESQETLVRACARLRAEGRDEHCVLVGDGPRKDMLVELSDRLGVADRVHFTGAVNHDEVVDYYSLIDVFVVPRTRERASVHVTPLKPFEAMSMGIPVVVSDLPALREVVDPPHRGWSFGPDDDADLARVLVSVLDGPEERGRRVRAASTWIHEERQWAHNGPRYRRYFESVLRGGGAR